MYVVFNLTNTIKFKMLLNITVCQISFNRENFKLHVQIFLLFTVSIFCITQTATTNLNKNTALIYD